LVDAERIGARLDRIERLIERLEEVRAAGEGAYLADDREVFASLQRLDDLREFAQASQRLADLS